MKKCITFLIFLLLSALYVEAQEYRIYIGSNLGNVSSAPPGFSARTMLGYQAGADVQLGKKHLYVQPGVQYSGTRLGLSSPAFSDHQSKLWVNGLKIPVMLGWRMQLKEKINWRVFSGPSFMAVTRVKHIQMNEPIDVLTDKNYHDVEWAWHLGTGLDWRFLFIDLGFQQGLTYVFTGASNGKSYTFYTNVGIRF